jgi:ABC-2 type transport system ATP-binding protein
VDTISRRQFWRLIDQLSSPGVTVLVKTHYLDEAEYCHRLALIHAGKLAALGSAGELKAIFASRPIVELRTPHPVAVMAALEKVDGVEKSSLFGTAVHAVLARPDVSPDAVVRSLEATGLRVDATDRVQPSLEDVFLDVVEKAGRA